MTLIADTYAELVAGLVAAGVAVVTDARNLRPPAVIVDPPRLSGVSASLVRLDFPVAVVAPPPGNRDALDVILRHAWTVIETYPTTTGEPGTYNVGGQDLPAYLLTITVTARKDPTQ